MLKRVQDALSNPEVGGVYYPADLFTGLSDTDRVTAEEMLIEAVELRGDVKAAMTLGALGCTRAVPALKTLSKSPLESTRRFAVLALAKATGSLRNMEVHGDGSSADLFTLAAVEGDSEDAIALLLQGLRSQDYLARSSACERLYKALGWRDLKGGGDLGSPLSDLTIAKLHVASELESLVEPAREKIEIWVAFENYLETSGQITFEVEWNESEEILKVIRDARNQMTEVNPGAISRLARLDEGSRERIFELFLGQLGPRFRRVGAPASLVAVADTPFKQRRALGMLREAKGALTKRERLLLDSEFRAAFEADILHDQVKLAFDEEVSKAIKVLESLIEE